MPVRMTAEQLMPLFQFGIKVEHVRAGRVMVISGIRPDKTKSGRPSKKSRVIREDGKETVRTNNDLLFFDVTAFLFRQSDGTEERAPAPGSN
jgi:hypothetical protein